MNLTTPIIPSRQNLVEVKAPKELDLEAICTFVAMGFFLEADTYWRHKKVLTPAAHHKIQKKGLLIESTSYFQWHYSPRSISFQRALEEFRDLFETIVQEQTVEKQVILPLSGGLDSRTQAAALQHRKEQVYAYSYKFSRGYDEVKIAQELASKVGFRFKKFEIPEGYLWDTIDQLAIINSCYSDFTSPRQMAIKDELQPLGDIFSLGHWGDVLFDDMKVPDDLSFEKQVEILKKKLLKPGGLELAQDLWELWELEGTFEEYFYERIKHLLGAIDIPQSANAQIRAFKSLYWAPRWTSVNLAVFENIHPITLPYYDNRMCEFICTVPEDFLKSRQLQIAYIKTKNPKLAKVTWQDQRPFNLTNYKYNTVPYNLPYRLFSKVKRMTNKAMGKPYVMRNWELQFLGKENQEQLERHIYSKAFLNWIPEHMVKQVMNDFYKSPEPRTAHPINMLLVLKAFNELKIHA